MPDSFLAAPRTLTALALLALLGLAVPAIPQEASQAAGPPYRVGGEVSRPELISKTNPVYTELARRARVTGTVITEAVIDERGDVTDVRVLKGLPMGLDKAAVDAVKTWKFKPATRDGKPVKVYYVLTVNFQVDDSPYPYGPMFAKFLKQNPEFAANLHHKNFQEASELLDRWETERPAEPAIPLARIYILLEQGQFQEAWQKAQDDQGPERYESLVAIGAFALIQAIDSERRAEAVELGLQATTAAIAVKADGLDAIRDKSMLLKIKAGTTLDPKERQSVIAEMQRLQVQAAELQKARDGGNHDHP